MMKLVFEYNWIIDCVAGGVDAIPIEYDSIEDFQLMVLDKIKEHKDKCISEHGEINGSYWYRNGHIQILGREFNVGSLEDCIEHRVYTLEQWFENNKIKQ